MPGLISNVDPQGLLEYSVVYTDRALNHMSQSFQGVMSDISSMLKEAYNAEAVVVVPGSGTFGMEAVARQFATGKKCLVVRNGLFSFRWSQIFDMGDIPSNHTVHKARPVESGRHPAYAPAPIDEVVVAICSEKPDLVFAPHVETSAGMILPDDYIKALADAVHEHGGMMVLDCIASGTLWIDMQALGVDVLISAPQKGWSGSPCAGLVMLSALASERLQQTASTSFSCDLKKWCDIMTAYENGGHAYHATMPTDGLKAFAEAMRETKELGFTDACAAQEELGAKVRELLSSHGIKSLAAPGFQAPSVVVSYTDDAGMHNGKKFAELGMQIAAGVPLQCDEAEDFQTFRIGLFGLDKLKNVDRTVTSLAKTLNKMSLEAVA
ncbi:MAG: aminotransferase class V-fold PLP-dependent enzyme [Arenicellales bacterium]|jgi:aspartate aminotransferase-like enzyme|nr:aminotransferase class V-fold PLP-dependent enzyme [Arenicellales bacterium]